MIIEYKKIMNLLEDTTIDHLNLEQDIGLK